MSDFEESTSFGEEPKNNSANRLTLYHGSQEVLEKFQLVPNDTKASCGAGLYLTANRKSAETWGRHNYLYRCKCSKGLIVDLTQLTHADIVIRHMQTYIMSKLNCESMDAAVIEALCYNLKEGYNILEDLSFEMESNMNKRDAILQRDFQAIFDESVQHVYDMFIMKYKVPDGLIYVVRNQGFIDKLNETIEMFDVSEKAQAEKLGNIKEGLNLKSKILSGNAPRLGRSIIKPE